MSGRATKTVVEEFTSTLDGRRAFLQEAGILSALTAIEKAMRDRGVNEEQLADKLGRSVAWVNRLLNGDRSLGVRTVADVLAVLGYQMRVTVTPWKGPSKLPEA